MPRSDRTRRRPRNAEIDRRSRYARSAIGIARDRSGDEVRYFELREIPPTDGVFRMVADATDRLDLLAHRFYRDPTKFWRICDASDHLDPTDVVAPNVTVVIPPDRER